MDGPNMADAEQFAPTTAFAGNGKIEGTAARISAQFRKYVAARRAAAEVCDLNDHNKRDIGLIGQYEQLPDFDADLRRIHASYAW